MKSWFTMLALAAGIAVAGTAGALAQMTPPGSAPTAMPPITPMPVMSPMTAATPMTPMPMMTPPQTTTVSPGATPTMMPTVTPMATSSP